jgi:Uma2 family endonuclease
MTPLTTILNPAFFLDPAALKRWTVQDYHRMGEMGLLDCNERTELIAGQVLLMVAKGTPHVTSLHLLADALRGQIGGRALVRTQDPIRLDNFSEPEPDLAIVRGTVLDYAERHPHPGDIYLVVEVADSTLKQDCEVKDKLYAQAGIIDYWVVDLKHRQLHIFRDPTPWGYSSHLILQEPNEAATLAFTDVSIALSEIFPPVS